MIVFAIAIEVRQWSESAARAEDEVRRGLGKLAMYGQIGGVFSVKKAEYLGGRMRNRFKVWAVVEAESEEALVSALREEFDFAVTINHAVYMLVNEVTTDLEAVA